MFIFSNQNQHLFDVAYAIMCREWLRSDEAGYKSDTFLYYVLREVEIENGWCRPPLTATEVKGIVANAAKWFGFGPVEQDKIRFARTSEWG